MELSIVITTFNRAGVLRRLLEAFANQDDIDFQVVVAIDGSTDGTEVMLSSLTVPYRLKWVDTRFTGYGLAVARNLGILAADGTAIVILDDDSFPTPGFVAEHKRSAAPGVITGGPRSPADSGNIRMASKMKVLGSLPGTMPTSIEELRRTRPGLSLVENNICMTRDDLIAMGLFSERLKLYGFIGQEFFARAQFLGMKYQVNHKAVIIHHGEMVGDNGVTTSRKVRQTRIARLVRPSLLLPRHFVAQVAWAQARAAGLEYALPPYRLHAALALPWRTIKMVALSMKRRMRGRGKGP